MWGNGITADVHKIKMCSEGVILTDVWHTAVADFGCVSSTVELNRLSSSF